MSDKGRKIVNTILALLVSMAAWVFVVYNYDPMTKEKYSGIPITYTGLENLANRGYAVAETNHERVDVTLEQRRIDTGNISSDDAIADTTLIKCDLPVPKLPTTMIALLSTTSSICNWSMTGACIASAMVADMT